MLSYISEIPEELNLSWNTPNASARKFSHDLMIFLS
jgi:hypothetical protein